MPVPLVPREQLLDRVRCPVCRGPLNSEPARLVCGACGEEYRQPDEGWLDCRPAEWRQPHPDWLGRQQEMEGGYADLIGDPDHARLAYRTDFEPLRPLFADAGPRLLDIGGGNGLLRHILRERTDYWSLDPSTSWLRDDWLAIANAFPCLGTPLSFVRGVGEHLPFADSSFDAVAAVWSLNHCARPAAVIAEARRVLAPGGLLVLVLEDVPPRWGDLVRGRYVDPRYPTRAAAVRARLVAVVNGWPLQTDHIAIAERDLARWTTGLSLEGRGFSGAYLWCRYRRVS